VGAENSDAAEQPLLLALHPASEQGDEEGDRVEVVGPDHAAEEESGAEWNRLRFKAMEFSDPTRSPTP